MKKLLAVIVVALFILCGGCSAAPLSAVSDSSESSIVLGNQAIAAVECPPDLANFPKGDAAAGANVFGGRCVACHINGGNIVNRNKTLNKSVLEKYNMYSAGAIITQVTCGKGVMPAFGNQFTSQQIADVAAYVLYKADKW